MPVISLSTQKDIALEVTVTNLDKDDAYEALVIVNLPNSLTYSAYRVPANVSLSIPDTLSLTYEHLVLIGMCSWLQELPVSCKANTNGSSAECELGNPFKGGAKVRANYFFLTLFNFFFHTLVIVNAWKKTVCVYIQTTFYIILSTAGISLSVTEVEINLQLNT